MSKPKYFISYVYVSGKKETFFGNTITAQHPVDWQAEVNEFNAKASKSWQEFRVLFWAEISEKLFAKYKERYGG